MPSDDGMTHECRASNHNGCRGFYDTETRWSYMSGYDTYSCQCDCHWEQTNE